MKYAIVVTASFILIAVIQMYYLLKNRLIKEAVVSLIFIGIALIYCYSEIFLWDIPGPAAFLTVIFDPLSKLVFGESYKY